MSPAAGSGPANNRPYDTPDAAALIDAVRTYLHDDLMERTEGPDRWLLRIAANALAIAGRELASGQQHRVAHEQRLRGLGVSSDAELAERIRSGDFDNRWEEVHEALAIGVAESLSVANPRHTAPTMGGHEPTQRAIDESATGRGR